MTAKTLSPSSTSTPFPLSHTPLPSLWPRDPTGKPYLLNIRRISLTQPVYSMWVVDAPSPGSSGPPTPSATPAVFVPPPPISSLPPTVMPPYTANPSPSISASAIPGASMSGRLSGVVSLTDILNLFARASGLTPHDPDETRRQRRRSSSASFRRSTESSRSESTEPGMRRPSVSSRSKDIRSER